MLELINKFSKFSGYEINIQHLYYFYTVVKHSKNEIKKNNFNSIYNKSNNIMGIYLSKEVQNLHS